MIRWISVKKKLPPKNETVLVYTERNRQITKGVYDPVEGESDWWLDDGDGSSVPTYYEVTKWSYLRWEDDSQKRPKKKVKVALHGKSNRSKRKT